MKASETPNRSIESMRRNMLNYALMLTSNRTRATDLVAATIALIEEGRAVEAFDGIDFKSRLFSMMHELFLSSFQSLSPLVSESSQVTVKFPMESTVDTVEGLRGVVDEPSLTTTISTLDTERAVMFTLHATGYSASEIGRRMGRMEHTIKKGIMSTMRSIGLA